MAKPLIGASSMVSYGEACLAMRGEVKISGQCCIQSADTVLQNRVFREILLK